VSRGQELAQLGNSGRSPEPHLHLQLNGGPWLASPSLPARFGSWVELQEEGPVLHPLGRPRQGMRIAPLAGFDWPDRSACHPLAVPGRQWRYRTSGAAGGGERRLELRAGTGGRLLLDDGASVAQVIWWPGWIELQPLREGDPDGRGQPRPEGLCSLLLLLSPALPLRAPEGLRLQWELRSTALARGLRRLFTLEEDGRLELRVTRSAADGLEWESTVHSAGRLRLRGRLRCEPHRGWTRIEAWRDGRLWLDAEPLPPAGDEDLDQNPRG
jgi:hypothetical protein